MQRAAYKYRNKFGHLTQQTEIMPIRRSVKTLLSKVAWRAYNNYRKGVHYHSQFSRTAALLEAPRETIEAFQAEPLRKTPPARIPYNPYYREVLKTESPDILQIPPLEKRDIREHLARPLL